MRLFYAILYPNCSIILAHHMRMIACHMSSCLESVDGEPVSHSTAFLVSRLLRYGGAILCTHACTRTNTLYWMRSSIGNKYTQTWTTCSTHIVTHGNHTSPRPHTSFAVTLALSQNTHMQHNHTPLSGTRTLLTTEF